MPSPGGQFLSDEFGDIEDYFISDYQLIDQYIGDQLFTWGINVYGGLGINNTTTRSAPVTTFAGGTNWKSAAVTGFFAETGSFAIKTDGTLWGWGINGSLQLGINTSEGAFTGRSTPVTTFAGGTNWKSVGGGGGHTAAIKTDGTLWVWGYNENGHLGINNTTQKSTPVTTFSGGTNWKQVSCGLRFTAAIKTDGTLWTWGLNEYGQLGINNLAQKNTPVTTFVGGTNWKQVSCSSDFNTSHVAAIKTDGTLWTWGRNDSGQLGINVAGDINCRTTPTTTFAGGTNWKSVFCGSGHIAAIKTDGTLWTWGGNGNGQLGINNTTNRSTPVTTFAGGTNWKSISGGGGGIHTAAIKTDGTLWVWGPNNNGQLGINEGNVSKLTPVTTFAGGTNWKQVVIKNDHTIAIQSGLNVDLS